jgi:hypothetical protein
MDSARCAVVKLFERVFLVIFARIRRKNANLDSAWRAARNKMFGYMVLPAITIGGLFSVATFGVIRSADRRPLGEVFAILIYRVLAFLLNRRVVKYVRDPPALAAQESHGEAQLIRFFWATSFGVFVLTCIAAFLQGKLVSGH